MLNNVNGHVDSKDDEMAAAQVKGIPFLAFDAGGVLEMFSGKVYGSNVMFEPTIEALTSKLNEVTSQTLLT